MQLQPGEKSILAYFTNQKDASNALSQLQALGYSESQINKISTYTRMNTAVAPHSIAARTGAGESAEQYLSYGPLLAASTFVSGLTNNQEEPFCTHMVTVVTEDVNADIALQVLRNYGARV